MKKQGHILHQNCSECCRKDALVHKYENLIRLYKKKQVKLSVDVSSRLSSHENTYQISKNYSIQHTNSSTILIVGVIQRLIRQKYRDIFQISKQNIGKKLGLMTFSKNIQKQSLFEAFRRIKLHDCKIDEDTMRTGVGMISIEKKKSDEEKTIQCLNNDKILNIICQQQLINQKELFKNICKKFQLIREDIECGSADKKQREIMLLKILTNKQSIEIKMLKESIQQLVRRQQRQYEKKKNSLQELGQQLVEKDQRIRELQGSLKIAEARIQSLHPQRNKNNILQDDPVAMRKQLERLQQIIDKLNLDIGKLREKNIQLQQETQRLKKSQLRLLEENVKLNDEKLQRQLQTQKFQTITKQLNSLVESVKIKSKRISVCQKKLNQGILQSSQHNVIDQLKSEIILFYLANIDEKSYQLKQKQLFDSDQVNALNELKRNYLKLLQAQQQNSHLVLFGGGIDEKILKQKEELFQVHDRVRDMSDIFSMIQGNNAQSNLKQDSRIEQPEKNQKSNQGVTMRLLQMQLQKAKQVQKISELKEKFMHIRMLILNLLKSLQLQEGSLTKQCRGTIQVLIDMFEYSQEERSSMFVKKKLFGFI